MKRNLPETNWHHITKHHLLPGLNGVQLWWIGVIVLHVTSGGQWEDNPLLGGTGPNTTSFISSVRPLLLWCHWVPHPIITRSLLALLVNYFARILPAIWSVPWWTGPVWVRLHLRVPWTSGLQPKGSVSTVSHGGISYHLHTMWAQQRALTHSNAGAAVVKFPWIFQMATQCEAALQTLVS